MVEAYSLTGMLPSPEKQNVCVMFTDVRDFTTLSQETDLDTLFDGLSKHLGMQVNAVYNHGGYIDKFGGDGLMAIFDNDDMVENACRCALHIMETTRRNLEIGDNDSFPLGIGIHMGEVLTGNIGSMEHLDYSVIGETVNIASRLCNHADPMQIDVSEQVVSATGETDLHFDNPKRRKLKGYEQEFTIYELKWAEKKIVGSIKNLDAIYAYS
jgi:class 3 adenylate cyclase